MAFHRVHTYLCLAVHLGYVSVCSKRRNDVDVDTAEDLEIGLSERRLISRVPITVGTGE